ncbi:MAG: hypothetical protein H6626_02575 [Pseudobdellovibrionaceae bacterium]|nr:hypothetical protein [Bdellovibrionales bacterium]USN47994.1 MAG: hypothetical protein H6626_02575 [Pseudobdellovibrionaceae bacterium]
MVFIVFWMNVSAWGSNERSPNSLNGKRGIQTPNVNFFLTYPGASSAEVKKAIIEESDDDFEANSNLQWPPLPRAWLEFATTEYITSNTYRWGKRFAHFKKWLRWRDSLVHSRTP